VERSSYWKFWDQDRLCAHGVFSRGDCETKEGATSLGTVTEAATSSAAASVAAAAATVTRGAVSLPSEVCSAIALSAGARSPGMSARAPSSR
jgi:hypothetical protein